MCEYGRKVEPFAPSGRHSLKRCVQGREQSSSGGMIQNLFQTVTKMDFGDMWVHGGAEDGGGGAMKKVQVERVERRAQGVNPVAKSERYSVSGSSAHGPHSGKPSTQTAQL